MNYFSQEHEIKNLKFSNRICINPMEGCDSNADGTPSDLTIRRYERFANGGAGLIWFEAVAVCYEGRASAYQLHINEENAEKFALLIKRIKEINPKIKIICQATHSGRFSRPHGTPEPKLACHDPYLDERYPLHKDVLEVTDEYLDSLVPLYDKAISLIKKVGFDGVDIKACHRYLLDELLSSHTRKGRYGGSFENRTRLIRNVFEVAQKYADDNFILCSRFNVYSAIEYPYSFGTDKEDKEKHDYSEPIKLLKILQGYGLSMINVTMGTPYYNPHVNKPSKSELKDPVKAAKDLLDGAAYIKENVEGLAVVSTGSTYLKNDGISIINAMLGENKLDFAGFGRQAFAYSEFARDILDKQELDDKKCCICCNKCSELLRAGIATGCVIKDKETYLPIYMKFKKGEK